MAVSLGKIISSDLEEVSTSAEYYPSFIEVDLEQLSSGVSSTLSSFIKSLFSMSRSDSAERKEKKLLQASICHVIMHAVGKKHYISPLLLSSLPRWVLKSSTPN